MAALRIWLSLATLSFASASSYHGPSQACKVPDRSPIEWRPKANDTRVFQVGRHKDRTREIRVSIPPNYNGTQLPPPLIIAFHDKEMGTGDFEYASRLSDREINKDAIVVYPLANNDSWQSDIVVRRWQKDESKTKKLLSDDTEWMKEMLSDLDTVLCYDTARVHTTGLGTGGGMVHLIACDPVLSALFASYAIVAGGFGTRKTSPKWANCQPGYLPLPIMEIHGDDDKILPYLLNEWESARSRMSVPVWLEEWSERNMCGEADGEPMQGVDGTGTSVTVTKLENGGWMSEAEAYDGAAWRLAKSCPAKDDAPQKTPVEVLLDTKKAEDGTQSGAANDENIEEMLVSSPESFTLLHYRIKDYGHGWPTLQLKAKDGKKTARFFDATALVLDWFKIHRLPEPEGEIVESTDPNIEIESPSAAPKEDEKAETEEQLEKPETKVAEDDGHGEL